MKVRNIIQKAAVLGASATMLGATVMGALAYDLADYPADYIVDGQFDGKIVVGAKAATSDVLGAIDIAASLQANSVTEEEVDIPGAAGEVSLSGDAFRIETGSDLLELREPLGDVIDTLTASELEALQGGSITTDEGSTDYYQYLRLAERGGDLDNDGNQDLQEMAVNYVEDTDQDVLGDFLIVDDGYPFFEWEIEFSEGLESEWDTVNDELPDLEDEVFNIFGTDFTFVDSAITDDGLEVTLSFMAGDVSDTLREGETKTYTIDGVDYEVTAVFISDPNQGTAEAKFAVNGELTDGLGDGQTDTLNNGLQIGVRDLLVNSREGVVEFFLGANKVEFTDSSVDTDTFDGSVDIGNEAIGNAEISIRGNAVGSDKFEITSVRYRLTAESTDGGTLYVPDGHGLREFLDEPEGMLSPTFDIRYEGLKQIDSTPLELDAQGGDDAYRIKATNLRGKQYSWPLVSSETASTAAEWGDDDDDFWFTEGSVASLDFNISEASHFWISDEDFFLVSENNASTASEKDDSGVYQYKKIDTQDRLLTFRDASTGDSREESYTLDSSDPDILGVADPVFEGNTYTVWIRNGTGDDDYSIAVDLNGDGRLDGAQVGFTVLGGGTVNFDVNGTEQVAGDELVQSADGSTAMELYMTLTEPESEFDDATSDGTLTWMISERTNDELGLGQVSYSGPTETGSDEWSRFAFDDDPDDEDYSRGYTDFGTFVELYDPSGSDESEELTILYPETQVGAQVFVVAGVTERTGSGSGSVMRDVVNPIAVGLAVLDEDAGGMYGSENLIIVGGPCANTVAAEFLGNPANCAEGFEPGKAMISAKDVSGTVATLVAGYEATETLGASYVLADYSTYLADVEGSEVEVIASDLSDLQVMAPTSE